MAGDLERLSRRAMLAGVGAAPLAAHPALAAASAAEATSPPAFLPSYFSEAMIFNGVPMTVPPGKLAEASASYTAKDQSASVVFEITTGDDATCDADFSRRANALLLMATPPERAGKVVRADGVQLRTQARTDLATADTALFRLPNAVLMVAVLRFGADQGAADLYQEKIGALVDHWRYDQAVAGGPIIFGRWAGSIHDYARRLRTDRNDPVALAVFTQLALWAPYDIEAKVDLAELTSDAKVKADNAALAYERSEDPDVRARAARLVGRKEPDLASVPVLGKGETGLQIILVPLPPCDLTLVLEATEICRKIIDVPIKLRRLPEPWAFGPADRIWQQRSARAYILKEGDPHTDFTGWTLDQYAGAMLSIADKKPPLDAYGIRQYVEKMRSQPGQINIGPSLYKLIGALSPYRPSDPRTFIGAVTGEPIYLGEANYVFNGSFRNMDGAASILSYDMMLSKNAGDPHESRTRVAERLGKEMVPASLLSMGVPRPSDPSDPASYADSVRRVDEKSMTLSPATREALDKLRQGAR